MTILFCSSPSMCELYLSRSQHLGVLATSSCPQWLWSTNAAGGSLCWPLQVPSSSVALAQPRAMFPDSFGLCPGGNGLWSLLVSAAVGEAASPSWPSWGWGWCPMSRGSIGSFTRWFYGVVVWPATFCCNAMCIVCGGLTGPVAWFILSRQWGLKRPVFFWVGASKFDTVCLWNPLSQPLMEGSRVWVCWWSECQHKAITPTRNIYFSS